MDASTVPTLDQAGRKTPAKRQLRSHKVSGLRPDTIYAGRTKWHV
jgi:hypothetical protein